MERPHLRWLHCLESEYLLIGLMKTPSGENYYGSEGKYYRVYKKGGGKKNKCIEMEIVDRAVMQQFLRDISSPEFLILLKKTMEMSYLKEQDRIKHLESKSKLLAGKVQKLVKLCASTKHCEPFLKEIELLEEQRKDILNELASTSIPKRAVNELDIRRKLNELSNRVNELENQDQIKDLLRTVIKKVYLDPATLDGSIEYNLSLDDDSNWNKLTSPRGFEPLFPP